MPEINAEIYLKSINEKQALTFLISEVWHKWLVFTFSL